MSSYPPEGGGAKTNPLPLLLEGISSYPEDFREMWSPHKDRNSLVHTLNVCL